MSGMMVALLVVSGCGLFLAGVVAGVVLFIYFGG